MNEQTHLFIKYPSHTLFSKGLMLVVCDIRAKDGDRLLYWPQYFFLILAGLLNRGTLRAPLSAAGSQLRVFPPTDSNCLKPSGPGYIIV